MTTVVPGSAAITLVRSGATLEDLQIVSQTGARRHVSILSKGWDAADVTRVLVHHDTAYRIVDVRTGRAAAGPRA